MDYDYTEEELEALDRKMCHPEEEVICPRCGKTILYRAVGNSLEVKCETEGCLYGSLRGI